MMRKTTIRLFLLVLILTFFSSQSDAAFQLSVTPYEGGYDLKFGKVKEKINKEVSVRITSTIGKQYRLVQRLLEPLSTADGIRIAQNDFLVYGIRGTNRFGTLLEREVPVSLGRNIIYTSNRQGNSDSFNLVYVLKVKPDQAPGYYRGRITYSLIPIDSTQSPERITLNIFAEVEENQESRIKIMTLTGTKMIRLNAKERDDSSQVLVNIKGAPARKFKILQLVSSLPTSPAGDEFTIEKANYRIREASKGTHPPGVVPLSLRRETIYSSIKGEKEDFIINYNLSDNLEDEKVGKYRTNIKYFLEIPGSHLDFIDTLSLEIENPPIFNLKVAPETGGIIEFKDLKPLQPPRINEVIVEVDSNLGNAYQISQNLSSELVNKDGDRIPLEYFTLRTDSLETKGLLKYPVDSALKKSEMVLFVSDKQGSSDIFKVVYQLKIPLDLKSGDYSTRIVYSILEL